MRSPTRDPVNPEKCKLRNLPSPPQPPTGAAQWKSRKYENVLKYFISQEIVRISQGFSGILRNSQDSRISLGSAEDS